MKVIEAWAVPLLGVAVAFIPALCGECDLKALTNGYCRTH